MNGDTIMIRFVAINDYGNHFYLDNVNINGQNILTIEDHDNTDYNTSIYPNPNKGVFSIRTDANNMEVEIYSILGKLVAKENVIGGLQQIDISQQPKGVYFITLTYNGKTEQRKLVVQ